MRISLKLNAQTAAELTGQEAASGETRALVDLAESAGVHLEPMHEAVDDDELRTWFHLDVQDERVDELLERLRKRDDVESAYVKPPDALP
jgi:hypothetical protein